MLHDVLIGLGSLIAPRQCVACGTDRGSHAPARTPPWLTGLCPPCRGRIEVLGAACQGCGRGLGSGSPDRTRCSACRGTTLGGIRSTTALVRYRGPARALLHAVKYAQRDRIASPLGRALAARFAARRARAAGASDLLVVPVPLHPWRRLRRGFNQALAIAEGVSEVLERPVAEPLRRRRRTQPLHGVRRAQRAAVLEDAFAVARPEAIDGRPVLLVDDIRTSGATLRAAARALRRAGAGPIDAAVVGR